MRNPFSRGLGYLCEGCTGLLGLAGAGPASREISPLLLQVPGFSLEQIQQGVNLLFSIVVGCVTLWRMFKPKKVAIVPASEVPVIAVPPIASQPISPVPPPPDFKSELEPNP